MRIRGWGWSFRVIKFRADCLKHSETAEAPLRLMQIPLAPSSVRPGGIMCERHRRFDCRMTRDKL
jgi:hypothetical protein